LREQYESESFERILIDAPCSGFGVIRSKPDIKYTKQPQDIEQLQKIQLAILDAVSPLLKVTGKLIYSTCTIEKCENDDVVKTFLANHPEFEIDSAFMQQSEALMKGKGIPNAYGLQIFPQTFQSDGFFITRLIRKQQV
jgi:16S rRNA (cytosine967-C5)-methyltransferase